MRTVFLIVLMIAIPFICTSQAQPPDTDPPTPASAEKILDLIEQLDGNRFRERQLAEQELLRLGTEAIPAMETAMENATGEAAARLLRILEDLRRSIRLVEIQREASLERVVAVAISADGRYLYATAYTSNAITIFEIDPDSGRLTLVDTLHDPVNLNGAVATRLAPTRDLAAAVAFRARSVTLLHRDQATGKFTPLHTVMPTANQPSLRFPIDVMFSPDAKFLYVLDPQAIGVSTRGAIFVYRITADRTLEFIESNVGQRNCFDNPRGIVCHPTLNQFYVTSSNSGTLTRVEFDRESGKTIVLQIVADEQNGVTGLAGAMSVTISRDGKFLYTSAGRFSGDSCIGVCRVADDGTLSVIEEHVSGRDQIGNFLGGNELLVSPDGNNVYATGTRSSTLAGFSRDPDSGHLHFIETVSLGGNELGPAGLTISANGKYVDVAVEGDRGIAVFRREQAQ